MHSKFGDSDSLWRSWALHEEGHNAITYVVQGPFSIIVTGDLASMVFERPGGLGLGFVTNMSQYVHEKCASGASQWTYSREAAEETIVDLFNSMFDELADCIADKRKYELDVLLDHVFDLIDAAQDLDLDDEREVGQWVYGAFGPDDLPWVGRVSSPEFLRARACILTVYRYETKETP